MTRPCTARPGVLAVFCALALAACGTHATPASVALPSGTGVIVPLGVTDAEYDKQLADIGSSRAELTEASRLYVDIGAGHDFVDPDKVLSRREVTLQGAWVFRDGMVSASFLDGVPACNQPVGASAAVKGDVVVLRVEMASVNPAAGQGCPEMLAPWRITVAVPGAEAGSVVTAVDGTVITRKTNPPLLEDLPGALLTADRLPPVS